MTEVLKHGRINQIVSIIISIYDRKKCMGTARVEKGTDEDDREQVYR